MHHWLSENPTGLTGAILETWLWMHFIPKLKWSGIEHKNKIKTKKGAAERLEVPKFSPFPASCTPLATGNCRRSRAICSDSSGTAQRGGGETLWRLSNPSRLPTVSMDQLNEHNFTWTAFCFSLFFFGNITISMNLSGKKGKKERKSTQSELDFYI